MEGRAQTDDWRYPHVGDLGWWFFMVVCHLDPREYIRLWHAGDKLVGYSILGEDPSFDVQVLPGYAWSGIEEGALTWAENKIRNLRKSGAQLWGGPIVSGTRQDDRKRIEFLEQHGFKMGGQFSEVNMLCTLSGTTPEYALPAGCQVHSMTESNPVVIAERAAAQREVWQPWTVGNVTDEDYAQFMRLPGYERELDIVAVAPDGVIAAYVNGWIDPLNKIGDCGPVGARPAYRRQGFTQAVLLECLRRMQARGMKRVSVSTGVINTPAIRLYESVGFKIVNQYLEYVKPGDGNT
jgi:ribosomal protein S18 acetylase RimI-like enzyme